MYNDMCRFMSCSCSDCPFYMDDCDGNGEDEDDDGQKKET